jgi:hypothetical protein
VISGRARSIAFAGTLTVLFLTLRALISVAREPFYDELFSAWMARQPFASILQHLRLDSGPPLYYFLARFRSVEALRIETLLFASVPFAILLRQRRWLAALLLAVHPAAALFSVTARPYALCAALVAIGLLLLERERVFAAAGAFVLAAYTHYLGVLFLPTLLFARGPLPRRLAAGVLAAVAFVPGLLLSSVQPRESMQWMQAEKLDTGMVLSPLSFLSDDPGAPLPVIVLTAALTLAAASGAWRRAPFVLVPLALVVGLAFFAPVFFPIRFASLIAFPLVLWLEESLTARPRAVRLFFAGALALLGAGAIYVGAIEHFDRPLGSYRRAARVLRENAAPGVTIVATGYPYLETVHQLGEQRVRAVPLEQAAHPGWRAVPRVVSPAELPDGPFLWIAERDAPELAARRGRPAAVLYVNERAVILRVR